MGTLRYLIPNAVTSVGIVFAALSIQRSIDGQFRTAAWWAMFCLLTDKIDGATARKLNASSPFGAQLDSFSDFFSFGVAPAALFYAFFSSTVNAGWSDPTHRVLLSLLVFFHIICVAARLARFNVTHDVKGTEGYFFGWPTTYVGGLLSALFVLCIKYGDPAWSASDPSDDTLRIFGSLSLTEAMSYLPWLMIPGGIVMVSKLRMPKVNLTGTKWIDALMIVNFFGGYGCGLLRRFPEYMVAGGVSYMLIAIRYHFFGRYPRELDLPPWFASGGESEHGAPAKGT